MEYCNTITYFISQHVTQVEGWGLLAFLIF